MSKAENVNQIKSEQEFAERLNNRRVSKEPKVNVLGFTFQKPRYWNDPLLLSRTLNALKLLCTILLIICLGINLNIVLINDKKSSWELLTYTTDGNVRWTNATKKQ